MLMLIAMTFNPGIFLALVVGYFFGDFIFYHKSGVPSLFPDPKGSVRESNERLWLLAKDEDEHEDELIF